MKTLLQEGFMTKEEEQVYELLLIIMQTLQTDIVADDYYEIRVKMQQGGCLH